MDRNSPITVNEKQRLRRVDSEDKLVSYIRAMLGAPMIDVEVSDDQILLLIDDTIRKFSDFAYGGEQSIAFVVEGRIDIQDYKLDTRIQSISSVSFGNSLGATATGNGGAGINLGPGWGSVGIGYVPHVTMQGEVSTLEAGKQVSVSSGTAGGVAGGTAMDNLSNAYTSFTQRDTMQSMFAKGVNFEFNANTKILRVFEKIAGDFMIEASIEYMPNPDYDEIYSHSFVKEYSVALTKKLWSTVTGKYSQSLVGGAEINYDKMQQEADADLDRLNEDLLNKYSEAMGIFSG